MVRVLRMLVPPFVVLFILLVIFALPKAHLDAGSGANWQTMTGALAAGRPAKHPRRARSCAFISDTRH